jgi:hypothetical protein
MNESAHDRAIIGLEERIESLREEMEVACRAWFSATEAFLREAYPVWVERAVTDQPDVARAKGVEKVPTVVDKLLNVDRLWAHRAPVVETSAVSRQRYAPDNQQPPHELDAEVGKVLGQVAPVLVKHGFGSKGSFGPWTQEFGRRGTSHWRLNQRYEWSPDMTAAIRRYADLYRDFHTTLVELEEVKRDKQRSEARNLWEQA